MTAVTKPVGYQSATLSKRGSLAQQIAGGCPQAAVENGARCPVCEPTDNVQRVIIILHLYAVDWRTQYFR